MKKVLFIVLTKFDFQKSPSPYLKKKFLGLSRGIKVYVLARGKPFHKKIWGTDFYLLRPGFFFWGKAFFVAFWLCWRRKIDTIIAQSPLMEGFTATLLKKILKKELIVEIHGDFREAPFLSKKRNFEKLLRKVVPLINRFSLKSADKIRTMSTFTTNLAKEVVPQKPCFPLLTFIDSDLFFREKNINFNNFILFVGQLAEVKGLKYLIEAFHRLNFQFPLIARQLQGAKRLVPISNFQLIIVGDGPERENLENQTAKLGLRNKVEFKGKLSLEETKNMMKDCYCLVLPSLSEGLPRVIREAMTIQKPVIASNVGGIPDLIKDDQNGFLFEPKNSQELAEKLKILLRDKNLAIKMGQKGRKLIQKHFPNEKYFENYFEMINS